MTAANLPPVRATVARVDGQQRGVTLAAELGQALGAKPAVITCSLIPADSAQCDGIDGARLVRRCAQVGVLHRLASSRCPWLSSRQRRPRPGARPTRRPGRPHR
jgi:hypothetical protein